MIDEIYDFNESYDTILIVRPHYLRFSYTENKKQLYDLKRRIDKRKG